MGDLEAFFFGWCSFSLLMASLDNTVGPCHKCSFLVGTPPIDWPVFAFYSLGIMRFLSLPTFSKYDGYHGHEDFGERSSVALNRSSSFLHDNIMLILISPLTSFPTRLYNKRSDEVPLIKLLAFPIGVSMKRRWVGRELKCSAWAS